MFHPEFKKGTFRWRKHYKKMPTREQLVEDLNCDWLANRLVNIIHKYYGKYACDEVQMLRVREFEFVYIINTMNFQVTLEIMQKCPFGAEEDPE